MIEYVYCQDYKVYLPPVTSFIINGADALKITAPTTGDKRPAEDWTLTMHAKVFAAGERYNIRGLQMTAHAYFLEQLNASPAFEDVALSISVIYNSTHDSVRHLRESIIEKVSHGENGFRDNPLIKAAVKACSDACWDLAERDRSDKNKSREDFAMHKLSCSAF